MNPVLSVACYSIYGVQRVRGNILMILSPAHALFRSKSCCLWFINGGRRLPPETLNIIIHWLVYVSKMWYAIGRASVRCPYMMSFRAFESPSGHQLQKVFIQQACGDTRIGDYLFEMIPTIKPPVNIEIACVLVYQCIPVYG